MLGKTMVSFLFLGATALGVLLAIIGLVILLARKDLRIVGIIVLGVGCLLTAASLGTFLLLISRMG